MGLMTFAMRIMARVGKKHIQNLEKITADPRKCQEELLFHILDVAKDSEFGKKYDFASIGSVEEFQRRVPVAVYDDYAPYVERIARGEQNVLTGAPIVYFNKTSGTIGTPKKIPLAEEQVGVFGKYNALYMNALAVKCFGKKWLSGKCLSLTEGKYEVLPSGIGYGSASALASKRMSGFGPFKDMMGGLYTSPYEARLPDPETNTRYLHAAFALRERNVTYATTTFSSYLLEIMRYIESNWEMLVHDIETGTIHESVTLSDAARASLARKWKPDPRRAAELRAIFEAGFDTPVVPKLWPGFTFALCVGGASFRTYSEKLQTRYFGGGVHFIYLGLSASEGYFSAPTDGDDFNSVFVPDGAFFEFLPLGDDDLSHCKTLWELEVGGRYEVLVTNRCGFYRYRMRDAVEVTGKHNETPTMQFLYRVDQTVSITGEKTTEVAIKKSVEDAAAELGVEFYDYSLYPDVDAVPLRYVYLLEVMKMPEGVTAEMLRAAIDRHLAVANPSMGDKIEKGICAPSGLLFLQPETYLLYRDVMVARGAAAAQLKPVHIIRNEFQRRFLFGLTER